MKKRWMISALLCWAACGAQAEPKLVCDEPVFKFGPVGESAVVTNVFRLRNEGDTSFVAGSVRAVCGCTKVRLDRDIIGPGETASLTAVFTARRQAGAQRKAIYLQPAGAETRPLVFYMEGFVEPAGKSH